MKTFSLDIVTPERLALTQEVELVSVPSTDGEITILPHHVPIFASLTEGEVRLHYENEDYYLSIGGGFIEVTPTNIWECKSGLIRQNGEIIHTDKWMEDVPERKFRTGPCEAVLQSIE